MIKIQSWALMLGFLCVWAIEGAAAEGKVADGVYFSPLKNYTVPVPTWRGLKIQDRRAGNRWFDFDFIYIIGVINGRHIAEVGKEDDFVVDIASGGLVRPFGGRLRGVKSQLDPLIDDRVVDLQGPVGRAVLAFLKFQIEVSRMVCMKFDLDQTAGKEVDRRGRVRVGKTAGPYLRASGFFELEHRSARVDARRVGVGDGLGELPVDGRAKILEGRTRRGRLEIEDRLRKAHGKACKEEGKDWQ